MKYPLFVPSVSLPDSEQVQLVQIVQKIKGDWILMGRNYFFEKIIIYFNYKTKIMTLVNCSEKFDRKGAEIAQKETFRSYLMNFRSDGTREQLAAHELLKLNWFLVEAIKSLNRNNYIFNNLLFDCIFCSHLCPRKKLLNGGWWLETRARKGN